MPSVMGLLEERELAARQRVEALRVGLEQTQERWQRLVIARETAGEVLSAPAADGPTQSAEAASPVAAPRASPAT